MATILFFGRLSDLSEPIHGPLPQGVCDTASLVRWLSEQDPALAKALSLEGTRIILNQAFLTGECDLSDSDEIAFVSPLSGG
ncbi:MAG: MoaD/ThiS family protein [Parvularcula sp.]